jgi:hypothetical protein
MKSQAGLIAENANVAPQLLMLDGCPMTKAVTTSVVTAADRLIG